MKNNKPTIILAIAALLVLGLYLYKSATTPKEEPTHAHTHSLYENEVYGYSFSFPEDLDLREYTPEIVSVGTGDEESFASLADIRIAEREGETDEDFSEFVYQNARSFCAADGPTGSHSCDEVEREEEFETTSGVVGRTFYLRNVVEDFTTDETTFGEKGPFFAFDISDSAASENFRALIIQAPTALDAEEVDADLIREIARSVEINRVLE